MTENSLSHTNLQAARLVGADLQGAKLEHVNLQAANLSEADLRHAQLSHCNLMVANLKGAKTDGLKTDHTNMNPAGPLSDILKGLDINIDVDLSSLGDMFGPKPADDEE